MSHERRLRLLLLRSLRHRSWNRLWSLCRMICAPRGGYFPTPAVTDLETGGLQRTLLTQHHHLFPVPPPSTLLLHTLKHHKQPIYDDIR